MLKMIPARPIAKTTIYLKFGYVPTQIEQHMCPRCKKTLNAGPNYQPTRCDSCGQKINFSGIQWKEPKEVKWSEKK